VGLTTTVARGIFDLSHERTVPDARDMINMRLVPFLKKFVLRVLNFEEAANWVSNVERLSY
jgi:hypothetical protein